VNGPHNLKVHTASIFKVQAIQEEQPTPAKWSNAVVQDSGRPERVMSKLGYMQEGLSYAGHFPPS
jgi:hypothetical protein